MKTQLNNELKEIFNDYQSVKEKMNVIDEETCKFTDKVDNYCNKIVEPTNSKNASWEDGARVYLKACIYSLLEENNEELLNIEKLEEMILINIPSTERLSKHQELFDNKSEKVKEMASIVMGEARKMADNYLLELQSHFDKIK